MADHVGACAATSADDFVVERYTATGTQRGQLGDIPASGRVATWTGINIFRIECGRIAEVWAQVDAVTHTQQLTGPGPIQGR
jgi:predicted ester cyclase